MIRYTIPLVVLLLFSAASATRGSTISGTVRDEAGYPLAGANVFLNETFFGAASDMDGEFTISGVTAGSYTLIASLMGYKPFQQDITIHENDNITLSPVMLVDPVALEELIFEAEKEASQVAIDKPIRKETITVEDLATLSTDGSVRTALTLSTGLNTKACALCGSAGVGMQGLDASYTEVTVNGMPVLSGLGSLYGLDGISVSGLQSVEITKGSSDSRAGSAAMAGQVNLVQAKPGENSNLTLQLSAGETLKHNISGNIDREVAGIPTRFSAAYAAEPTKLDRNDDQITDTPQYHRLNFGVQSLKRVPAGQISVNWRGYGENRFAGDVDWDTSDRGSTTVYGREILTRRSEALASFTSNSHPWGYWMLESALVNHRQDSWYRTTEFDATQTISATRLSVIREWESAHTSTVQGQFRYERYDDNLKLASETDRTDRIPGIVVQHTWQPNALWTLQAGVTGESYKEDDLVALPRGSVLYQPHHNWSLRLSGGTAYRPVTIFSLDKAVHTGFEDVNVPRTLKPERSLNGSFSVGFREANVDRAFQVDVTAFRTTFENKVILSFTEHKNGSTVYTNALDAYAEGVETQIQLSQFTWI